MAEKRIYTFKDNSFYDPMIEKAETLEKKRFVDLYNHYHKTKYTVETLVGQLDAIEYDWRRMYVDILNGLERKTDIATDEKLTEEWWDLAEDLLTDLSNQRMNAELLAMQMLEKGLTSSQKIEIKKQMDASRGFAAGLERESERLSNKYGQIKGLDLKASFQESQGDWRLELKGDYSWQFSDSNISHWNEVKTDLSKFHITGSGSVLFLTPLIQQSKIVQKGDKYVVTFTAKAVDDITRKFLTRKFSQSGAYPVYEDGDVTILSSEMLRFFKLDGIQLFQSPHPLIPEESDVQQFNPNTRQGLETLVRNTFNKKKMHADLWYGKYS